MASSMSLCSLNSVDDPQPGSQADILSLEATFFSHEAIVLKLMECPVLPDFGEW